MTSFSQRLKIFLPFALGYFLSYLYRVINAVLAPNLAADIGIGPSELGLLTGVYFMTFAACQLPLGVLLDRFGPRRIEAALLVIAAAGALVFARSETLIGLIIGRGLIGIGVSACLMAAFKAFVNWFPKHRLPQINGFQMAAGGLGALTATAPVEAALTLTDWRGIFTVLSLLSLLVAACLFYFVPEQTASVNDQRFSEQIRGLRTVLASPVFRQVAPWSILTQSTMLAIHGLWAGPWLRDVAGFNRLDVAGTLSWMAVAMIVGFSLLGTAAERLNRRGLSTLAVAAGGMALFTLPQLIIILQFEPLFSVVWIMFAFLGTAGILPYAVLSQSFPPHLAGRVNTTLNLMIFTTAFTSQWGIGAIIESWPVSAAGGYDPAGYRVAFGIMLLMQLAAAFWFWRAGRRLRRNGRK